MSKCPIHDENLEFGSVLVKTAAIKAKILNLGFYVKNVQFWAKILNLGCLNKKYPNLCEKPKFGMFLSEIPLLGRRS